MLLFRLALLAVILMACKPLKQDADPMIVNANSTVANAPTSHVLKSTVYIGAKNIGCSGVVVGWRRILTAKHCLSEVNKRSEKIHVVFGPDLKPAIDALRAGLQPVNIGIASNRRVHAKSDLATIDLETELPPGFVPVELHSPGTKLVKGQRGVVAGYGMTGINEKLLPTGETRFIRWGWMEFKQWNEEIAYPNYVFRSNLEWIPSEGRSSTCKGDSGGPLYANLGNKWGLVGIISGSDVRCRERSFTADARPNRDWIFGTD